MVAGARLTKLSEMSFQDKVQKTLELAISRNQSCHLADDDDE